MAGASGHITLRESARSLPSVVPRAWNGRRGPARKTRTWGARLADIATQPGDSHDEKLGKRLQVTMAFASIPVVALWATSFLVTGHARAAIWPFAYCGVTAVMLAHLAITKRYSLFRTPHPAVVMIAPFALHCQLGGFLGSGGAILWCMLAPIAAMMFAGARASVPYFLAMVALVVAGLARDRLLPPSDLALPPDQASAFFAYNTVGFVAFLYLGTRYFVSRIDAEKARSDRLLLNVLPASIAERLKRGEAVIADRYDQATVLFCDIVGFTTLASRLAADDVVVLLDEIFTAFDALAARHGLEKIKTIGDAYMLVGGVPRPSSDHAARVCDAALAMRASLADLAGGRGLDLAMRIGVHSGPVVAGVIGRSKFTFDLWGDTVNTASRMESHGAADRVQISEATRALLGPEFIVDERGPISVKGKGTMRTFWLEGTARSHEA